MVFKVSLHAITRMGEWSVRVRDIEDCLAQHVVVEEYPEDTPYPSRLILGWLGSRPLHLVVAQEPETAQTIVVTLYQPDPALWDDDFTKRLA